MSDALQNVRSARRMQTFIDLPKADLEPTAIQQLENGRGQMAGGKALAQAGAVERRDAPSGGHDPGPRGKNA
jgi:hypothetical protein